MKDDPKKLIDLEQKRLMEEIEGLTPGSEEYLNATKALKTLSESKTEETKSKISPKVIVEGGIKLLVGLGLLVISSTHILDDKIERISDRMTPKDRDRF